MLNLEIKFCHKYICIEKKKSYAALSINLRFLTSTEELGRYPPSIGQSYFRQNIKVQLNEWWLIKLIPCNHTQIKKQNMPPLGKPWTHSSFPARSPYLPLHRCKSDCEGNCFCCSLYTNEIWKEQKIKENLLVTRLHLNIWPTSSLEEFSQLFLWAY